MSVWSALETRLWQGIYPLLLQLLLIVVRRQARTRENLRLRLEGLQGLWDRLEEQLQNRNPDQPLAWFHVASAGEYLQALPVMERLQAQGWQCGLTYSSINADRWLEREAGSQTLCFTSFLPEDTLANAQRLLRLIRPQQVVFVSYDLWPGLIWEVARASVPLHLISAIVHAGSFREAHPLGRSLYRTLYRCFNSLHAVSEEDAARIRRSWPAAQPLTVMGDTRCDSVLERRDRLTPPELPAWLQQRFVWVAGSTWPADEACFLPGLEQALASHPELLAILVPHEPHEPHLQELEARLSSQGPVLRWSQREALTPETRVLLVDAVGVLAGIYHHAHAAYVGGAFTTGVHNTMEPAARGLPVVFGPRFDNALEARRMVEAGVAHSVETPEAFTAVLKDWLQHPDVAQTQGAQAQALIESQQGAADRCLPWLLKPAPEAVKRGAGPGTPDAG